MVFHMKTTLSIDDRIMRRVKQEAARRRTTMSGLIESALRRFLAERPDSTSLPPLPKLASGGALVDVADRDALYQAMEGR